MSWCFSSVHSLSGVQLFATPRIAACQASLSITNSQSLLKPMPIESVMPSSHLILCRPLLILPPIPPSLRIMVFSPLFLASDSWSRSMELTKMFLIWLVITPWLTPFRESKNSIFQQMLLCLALEWCDFLSIYFAWFKKPLVSRLYLKIQNSWKNEHKISNQHCKNDVS